MAAVTKLTAGLRSPAPWSTTGVTGPVPTCHDTGRCAAAGEPCPSATATATQAAAAPSSRMTGSNGDLDLGYSARLIERLDMAVLRSAGCTEPDVDRRWAGGGGSLSVARATAPIKSRFAVYAMRSSTHHSHSGRTQAESLDARKAQARPSTLLFLAHRFSEHPPGGRRHIARLSRHRRRHVRLRIHHRQPAQPVADRHRNHVIPRVD